MLEINNTLLLLIDIQGKLAQIMFQKDLLFGNLQKIIKGAQALNLPIIWAEQNPEGLGPTVPEVADLLPGLDPIAKQSFSCCRHAPFMQALAAQNRKQVLLAGIETHVCVYQTAAQLIEKDYEVHVVADAVSSRTAENKKTGLEKMKKAGADITSVETALFELLGTAEAPAFKEILRIVK